MVVMMGMPTTYGMGNDGTNYFYAQGGFTGQFSIYNCASSIEAICCED